MIEWDDLKFVLAVSRKGSALGAAKHLRVNQTTVTRRLARLEATLGAELFERHQNGYAPTGLGRVVADAAARVETELDGLESTIAAGKRTIAGSVRFTCPETIGNHLLAPWLRDFRPLYPDVRIEVINADRTLDLSKGEADVAMRVGMPPTGAGIVARRLPDCLWSAYTSRAYARERGMPSGPRALRGHALVGLEGEQARLPSALWFEKLVGPERISVRCNSLSNALHSLRAGLGVGMMPCVIAETEPELVRCFPPPRELNAETWVIVREEVKSAPHVRAFVDFLVARATVAFEGRAPALAP